MYRRANVNVRLHALGDDSALPLAVFVVLLALLAVQPSRHTTISFFCAIRIPTWCKDPLGLRRQAARLAQLHERHRARTDGLAKTVCHLRGTADAGQGASLSPTPRDVEPSHIV